MTELELQAYLIAHFPKEDASCEWKEFKNLKHVVSGAKGDDAISYCSALANMEGGHLVMGVKDGTLDIVGIENLYGYSTESLPHRLLGNCINLSSEGLHVEEFVTSDTNKRVWVLHVPKHLPRKPVMAHQQAWQRVGDSLTRLSLERENTILAEPLHVIDDWSMGVCEGATIDDLDSEAVAFARGEFITKHNKLADEVQQWDDVTFLNKAKLSINGKITRTALLLLGKSSTSYLLAPAMPQITWILKDQEGVEEAYEHFGLPFILSVQKVFTKIRNIKYRYRADSKLFPEEVDKYDTWVLYEALHNAIVHQDYEAGGRINVVEFPHRLVISNVGRFIPGSIDNVIERDAPTELYRNPFLAHAMVEVNMIDTIGSGIKRMHAIMQKRYFPMPSYYIEENRVELTLFGRILDERYAKLLASDPELSLHDVIALDRIVKKIVVDDQAIKDLRSKGLIEGRKPNLYISADVAKVTGDKASYTKNRAMDKQYYFDLIVTSIKQHGSLTRKDIDELLWTKLPEYMDEKQRKIKINNLINELSNKLRKICNEASQNAPKWVLCKDS